MPFIHEVSFDLPSDAVSQLAIGAGVQRIVGFLRSLLPNEPGFVTARGMFSVDRADSIHVQFQSVWQDWDDLAAHQATGLAAEKALLEFGKLLVEGGLTVRNYEEIA